MIYTHERCMQTYMLASLCVCCACVRASVSHACIHTYICSKHTHTERQTHTHTHTICMHAYVHACILCVCVACMHAYCVWIICTHKHTMQCHQRVAHPIRCFFIFIF